MTIETGPTFLSGPLAWGLLGLAAILAIASAAVAIGLARFDGRADDATLSSMGALGVLPAFALGLPGGLYPVTPPWMQIALAAIALPIAIALRSWMLAGLPLRVDRRMSVR